MPAVSAALVLLPLKEVCRDNGENLLSLRNMLTFRNRRPIVILCSATLLLLTGFVVGMLLTTDALVVRLVGYAVAELAADVAQVVVRSRHDRDAGPRRVGPERL